MLRLQKVGDNAARDQYDKAADWVRANKAQYGKDNALLYHMDLGLLYHYMGKYDSSILELSQAVSVHDDLFAHSVTNEAVSLVVNDNARPYRGKPYEIVMLHQFLAFDYLAQSKNDDALVEAKQANLFLDELKRKAGKDSKEYVDDGMFRYLSSLAYQTAGQRDDAAIAMYQSVKAYKRGPVPLPPAVARQAAATLKAADRNDDLKELGLENMAPTASATSPGTGTVSIGNAVSGGEASGGVAPAAGGSEIIVIGQAGRAPALGQNVFWGTWERDGVLVIHYHNTKGEVVTDVLPAPGLPATEVSKLARGRRNKSGTTFHVKFAMPAVKDIASQTRFFTVAGEASPNPVKTEVLTDVNPLLSRYLDDNHGTVLARTVARVIMRTIAAEETKSAVSGSNPLLNLVLNIGTDLLSDELEQADTRSWFLLPRTVQIARIPVKAGTHAVTVEAHDAGGRTLATRSFDNLNVKPGEKKFVFFPSLR